MKVQKLLTLEESERLSKLEDVIESGRKTWRAAGKALMEIRDSEPPLYRTEHKTFDAYCKARWGFQRQRAYELISSVEAVKLLPAECNQKITNENQASELAHVAPDQRESVITKAAQTAADESRPMTAKDIKCAAEPEPAHFEPPTPPEPEQADEDLAKRQALNEVATTQYSLSILKTAIQNGTGDRDSYMATAMRLRKAANALETFAKGL